MHSGLIWTQPAWRTLTASARYADFHAYCGTRSSATLLPIMYTPKTAQQLARHSTITLTMDRYTHLHADDLAVALDALPDPSGPHRQTASTAGTYDVSVVKERSLPASLSPVGAIERNQAQSAWQ